MTRGCNPSVLLEMLGLEMNLGRGRRNRRRRRAGAAGAAVAAVSIGLLLILWRSEPVAAAGSGGISISPPAQQVLLGSGAFGVDVNAVDVSAVGSFDFKVHYDPQVMTFFGLAVGPFLSSTGRSIFCPPAIVDSIAGTVQFGCASSGLTPPGPTGNGRLATLAFTPVALGTSPLTFVNRLNAPYSDESGDAFTSFSFADGSVEVLPNNGTPLPTATQTRTPTITPTSGPTLSPTPTPTGIAPPGDCGPQIAIAVCPVPAVAAGSVGAALDIDIRVEDVANLGAFSVTIEYSNVVFPAPPSFTERAFLASSGRTSVCLLPSLSSGNTAATSRMRVNCVTLGAPPPAGTEPFGPAGSGTVGTFTFVPAAEGATIITIPEATILDAYAAVDPAGHSDVAQIAIGPPITPTPCAGTCPSATPTRTSTVTPVPTATDTSTPTRTPTSTSTPCSGACPTAALTSTPTATPTAGPATVRVEPVTQTVQTGQLAVFGVFVDDTVNLGAFALQVAFDPQVLAKVDVQGCMTGPSGCQPSPFMADPVRHVICFVQAGTQDNPAVIGFNCVMLDPPGTPGATGSGLLATISLQALAPVPSTLLHLQNVQLLTPAASALPVGALIDGDLHIIAAATATPCGGPCPTATPSATPTHTPTVVPGSIANVSISPSQQLVGVGQLVDISIDISAVQDLGSFQVRLQYDTQALEPVSVGDGGFIDSTGRIVFCPPAIADSGVIRFGCASGGPQPGPSGSGSLAQIRFRTLRQAFVDLRLNQAELTDPAGNDIPDTITDTADEIIILNSLSTATATPTRTSTPGPSPTPADQPACVTQPGGLGDACLVIDADPFTPGEQSSQLLPPSGSFTVDIVARNITSANGGLGFFNVTVLYDPLFLSAGTPTSVLPATSGFTCVNANGRLPEGDQFADGDPATGDAFINCFDPVALTGPTGDVRIARVPFTILGSGSSQLRFFSSSVSDESGGNIASCNPVDVQPGGGCLDGFVYNAGLPPPSPATPTPTATATPTAPAATNTPAALGTPATPNAVGGVWIAPDRSTLHAVHQTSNATRRAFPVAVALLVCVAAVTLVVRRRARARG